MCSEVENAEVREYIRAYLKSVSALMNDEDEIIAHDLCWLPRPANGVRRL